METGSGTTSAIVTSDVTGAASVSTGQKTPVEKEMITDSERNGQRNYI